MILRNFLNSSSQPFTSTEINHYITCKHYSLCLFALYGFIIYLMLFTMVNLNADLISSTLFPASFPSPNPYPFLYTFIIYLSLPICPFISTPIPISSILGTFWISSLISCSKILLSHIIIVYYNIVYSKYMYEKLLSPNHITLKPYNYFSGHFDVLKYNVC